MLAEVGFRLAGSDNPLILIPASVNERGPYEFILDTGAGMSLVSPRLSVGLGIATDGTREGAGAAGRVTVAIGRVESLAVGAARRGPMPIAVTAEVDRIGTAVGQSIDGDLGYDFLKAFTLTLDYQRRVIRLAQGGNELAGTGSVAHAQISFRLAGPVKPLVMVPAFVNGRGPHMFVLDTGASATVLSPALAAALRIETAGAEAMIGAGGILEATVGRVGTLAVGGTALQDVSVVVADFLSELGRVAGEPIEGILGYNFLRHFRVTLDYPEGVLWLMKTE